MNNQDAFIDDGFQDDFQDEWTPPSAPAAPVQSLARIEPVQLTAEQFQAITSPRMTSEIMQQKLEMTRNFINEIAEPGVDFGTYGELKSNAPTKPLAMKALRYFGLRVDPSLQSSVYERDFVEYTYKVSLFKDDYLIQSIQKSANSEEACFCRWVRWTTPASEDEIAYQLTYNLGRFVTDEMTGDKHWEAKKAHPNPRSISNFVSSRAIKRGLLETLAMTVPIVEIVQSLPAVKLRANMPPRSNGNSFQQPDRRQITQGEPQQAGRIVEASPKAFYNLITTKGWTKDAPEVKRISGPAYGNKISWSEAIEKAQQLPSVNA